MLRILFTLLTLLALPQTGLAQESHRMFSHKHWVVDVVDSQAGYLWCSAATRNAAGDHFSIGLWPNGDVTIYTQFWGVDFGGQHRFQPVMDIDYQRWTLLNSQRQGNGMMSWVGGDGLRSLLGDLQRGRAVAFKRNDGGNFASFSLAGSRAAIDALKQCGDYIGWRR